MLALERNRLNWLLIRSLLHSSFKAGLAAPYGVSGSYFIYELSKHSHNEEHTVLAQDVNSKHGHNEEHKVLAQVGNRNTDGQMLKSGRRVGYVCVCECVCVGMYACMHGCLYVWVCEGQMVQHQRKAIVSDLDVWQCLSHICQHYDLLWTAKKL